MKLWLLRHGEAEPQGRYDAERRLTENGRREIQHSAVHLAGRPLQAILASPYVRAQQSAKLVRESLGFRGAFETQTWLTPEANPLDAILYLDRRDEVELLLVTHQPFVGALAGLLIDGHRGNPLPMGTASLAELEGEALAAGLMTLVSLHHGQRG